MKTVPRRQNAVFPEAMQALGMNLVQIIRSSIQVGGFAPHVSRQLSYVSVDDVARELTLYVRAASLFPYEQQPRVRPLPWNAVYAKGGPQDAQLYALERMGYEPIYFSVSAEQMCLVNAKA